MAACGGGGAEPSTADAGQQLFAQSCAVCHGSEAVGTDQGPPLVHEIYEPSHHPDESFHSAVANGVTPHHWNFGPMPAIPNLSEVQVDAIVAYVRGLQREAGIE